MNERIAELLAKLDIDLYTDKGVMMTKILVSPKDLRQFAELIVQDCIDQTSIGNGHGNNQWDRALTFAANNIKDHYGVEE